MNRKYSIDDIMLSGKILPSEKVIYWYLNLVDGGELSAQEIAMNVFISVPTVHNALKVLLNNEFISRERTGKGKGRNYHYLLL